MSSPDDKSKRQQKMKYKRMRDPVAKVMNENRGAFALKIINPKKTKYKRVKLDPKSIDVNLEEE